MRGLATLKRRVLWRLAAGPLGELARHAVWLHPFIHGDPGRLHVSPGVDLVNAYVNTHSGEVRLGRNVLIGHGVSLIAGKHDVDQIGDARRWTIPTSGYDIVIDEGAWIASNATVLGPCHIGAHAVVAAGAVVTHDVPAGVLVGGVPAKVLRPVG